MLISTHASDNTVGKYRDTRAGQMEKELPIFRTVSSSVGICNALIPPSSFAYIPQFNISITLIAPDY